METKRTSSFIKRIDQYLLKNFPVTWSSRIHSAGVYATAFSLLIALLSFIVPNDPRNNTTIYYWIVLMVILSLLGFIFWMIYLLRFNVFKRFGKWSSIDTLKSFIFYFVIILVILSWSFIPPVIESVRANMKYTSEELAADINSMNIKICQLEQDSISKRFKRDTFEVVNYVQRLEKRSDRYNDNEPGIINISEIENYYFIDTATLRTRLNEADSVKKISDSLYVIYDCPDYTFINNYSIDEHSKVKLLSDMDLYHLVLQNKQAIDKIKTRTAVGQLFRKYSPDHDPATLSSGESYNSYGETSYISKINDKYDLYQIDRRIENIAEKKYRWEGGTIGVSWRLLYYFTLCISLIVLIYRHTTRRTFFLSLLAAIMLMIVTSLFIAMAPGSGSEKSFYVWNVAYFILFGVLSAIIFYTRHRNVISGIGLNLLVLMTPFMPLIITGLYYKFLHDRFDYPYNPAEYSRTFKNEGYHFFLSEIAGGVLLILLLATLYQMAYKKWFSLPEQ